MGGAQGKPNLVRERAVRRFRWEDRRIQFSPKISDFCELGGCWQVWKGPEQLELGHVGPVCLSCAPPLDIVPLPSFGESPFLYSTCRVCSRPHFLGWRDGNITSLANHITHHTRSGPSEWYRPVMTTGTLDGTSGKGF